MFRHSASQCVLEKNFVFFFTGRAEAFEFSISLEASASQLWMRLFCKSLELWLAVDWNHLLARVVVHSCNSMILQFWKQWFFFCMLSITILEESTRLAWQHHTFCRSHLIKKNLRCRIMPFPAIPKIVFIRNYTRIKTEAWKNFTTAYSEFRILPSLM